VTTTKVLRLHDVLHQTGLSRSTIYEMIGRGDFPRQIKLGRRAVGWMADEVDHWICQRGDSRSDNQSVFDSDPQQLR